MPMSIVENMSYIPKVHPQGSLMIGDNSNP